MKTTKTLSIILFLFSSQLFSQQSILLYTNYSSSIKILENNIDVSKTAIWEEDAGGYIIDVNNETKTLISANENINFKLSNDNATTKRINLTEGEILSIYKCLNSEEYCCERLTAKQQSATKKIYAVALMKKSALRNKTVIFSNLTNEFINKYDLILNWTTDSVIKSISIYDVNSMDIIFEKEYSENIFNIDYNSIKEDLKEDLKENNKYVLKVITRNLQDPITETKESSYEFSLKSIAFINKQYYYSTYEAVTIRWKTNNKIANVFLFDKKTNKIIKEISNWTENEFILSENINKSEIKSGNDYILKIELSDGQYETYPFIILLDNEENDNLKFLLD